MQRRFTLATPTYPATGPHLYLAVLHQAEKSQQWGLRCQLEGNLLSVPCSQREGRRNKMISNLRGTTQSCPLLYAKSRHWAPSALVHLERSGAASHREVLGATPPWGAPHSRRRALPSGIPQASRSRPCQQPQLPPTPSRPISRNPWHASRIIRSPLPPPIKIKGTARAQHEQNVKPSAS